MQDTLLVPRPYWDPDTDEAEVVVELAVPLLEHAAGKHIDAVIGDPDPVEAVRQLQASSAVDEVIVPRRSRSACRSGSTATSLARAGARAARHVVTAEQSARAVIDQG